MKLHQSDLSLKHINVLISTCYRFHETPRITIPTRGILFDPILGKCTEEIEMRMKFTLNMEDLIVEGKTIDNMILDWEEEVTQQRILEISNVWISSQTFLTERMTGLSSVGESSLTIEPIEE
jgi:hypothetical protein